MKVLACGSRNWHDEQAIETVLRYFKHLADMLDEDFSIVHGHCPDGADALVDRVAQLRLGMWVDKDLFRVPANWKRYGRGAGPKRNQQMLDEHHPDVVVAFRATGKSNGTDDMVRRGRKANVPVHLITNETHLESQVFEPAAATAGVRLTRTRREA